MNKFLKMTLCAATLTAASAMAAPSYPFPQNMKNPKGYTIPFASTDMIKDHFAKWKKAWMKDVNGQRYILAPEGTCSTVSEAIAYGMLIMVYMDDGTNGAEQDFKNLYNTWTQNGGKEAGMNWRIGCSGGSGSASDADFDAALALVMASKQWNNSQYLEDAKKIISWMKTNDINGSQIKPGSQWNDYFNPSYAATANFKVFGQVTNDASFWDDVITQAYKDLSACQNSTSGLVSDWCDWSSHQPTKNNKAAVAQDEDAGFFDDAARTPWRMAWAYYWFGDTKAQAFNKKINDWMLPTARTASGINSGYFPSGQAVTSEKRNFVSSTFSGGMGLAASSFDDDASKSFMETVYKTLSNMTSCEKADGCGESVPGEKYYPSTLNLLYLLLMTGNMPNLLDANSFEKFTPDPSLASGVSEAEGVQQAVKDSTVGISGFWNWGAYHDKLGLGTTMSPDSGASPVYLRNGEFFAEATMEIGPEPQWTQAKQDVCDNTPAQCELKYPSAGIAMSFLSDDNKGVNLKALGVKAVRVTLKSQGPIRMAVLNEITKENEKKKLKNLGAGSEPGTYVDPVSDYTAITYDLTPDQNGFKGDGKNDFTILDWVDKNNAPIGDEIIECVTGLKWEVKDSKGGFGAISIKAIEFLDASNNVIDPSKITGIVIKPIPTGVVASAKVSAAKVIASDAGIQILGAKVGSDYAVFSLQGRVVSSGKIMGATQGISVPSKGAYLVRVEGKISTVTVK